MNGYRSLFYNAKRAYSFAPFRPTLLHKAPPHLGLVCDRCNRANPAPAYPGGECPQYACRGVLRQNSSVSDNFLTMKKISKFLLGLGVALALTFNTVADSPYTTLPGQFTGSINNTTITSTLLGSASVPVAIGANVTISIPLTDAASSVGSLTFYFDTSLDNVNWTQYALSVTATAPNNTSTVTLVNLANVQANYIRYSKVVSTQTSAVTIGNLTYSVWPL